MTHFQPDMRSNTLNHLLIQPSRLLCLGLGLSFLPRPSATSPPASYWQTETDLPSRQRGWNPQNLSVRFMTPSITSLLASIVSCFLVTRTKLIVRAWDCGWYRHTSTPAICRSTIQKWIDEVGKVFAWPPSTWEATFASARCGVLSRNPAKSVQHARCSPRPRLRMTQIDGSTIGDLSPPTYAQIHFSASLSILSQPSITHFLPPTVSPWELYCCVTRAQAAPWVHGREVIVGRWR